MWTLLASQAPGPDLSGVFSVPSEGIAYIVLQLTTSAIGVVHSVHPTAHTALGRITIGPWGLKLEAIDNFLSITPGCAYPIAETSTVAATLDPRTANYELQPRTDKDTEILFLRHGDVIQFSRFAASLTCKWTASEVQVSSSAVEGLAVESTNTNGAFENPDEETEDENEDLEDSPPAVAATQKKSQQPDATPVPRLSNQRSVIVQETPTAQRFTALAELSIVSKDDGTHLESEKYTPSSQTVDVVEVDLEAGVEAFSTAHTGESQNNQSEVANLGEKNTTPNASRSDLIDGSTYEDVTPKRNKASPRIEIPTRSTRKRLHTAADRNESDSMNEAVNQASKRAKHTTTRSDDTQDSHLSNIEVDTSEEIKGARITKGKKRMVGALETAEAIPSRSQRSSQQSNATIADAYEGPTPRVALSNSSITKTGHAVKFLKKQGGTLVESISEPFNILCVRDGELHKTPKVLLSIARGTAIVTDKWLLDSAKEEHFLSVMDYKPSAPKQEQEWRIKLHDVLGQPQTPFDGYTIHFTKSLKTIYSPFTEIEQVCKAAGANKVTNSRLDKNSDAIVLAKDDDPEVERLMQEGITCYNRDLITHSIFRGYVDLDSNEFKIGSASVLASAPKETKKRGRKGT